ncbi:fumarylacetoacetate hydrolase family protein [Calidifontibacter sp. DB0510]|uniref:Fumarylacetoacetate hydrolase family protein n=1 Tax=Metallococcus carri TaxID=1656884 RepID=A0A967ECY4_9MICO|nr:fumarylacetoacetate hydrolase family protein [Metallococcus carri]NHN54181.1 fumarylacetoacetate hydrolase family protein [Metallococcus carri]NOP36979.1 fumarylacetoacetate hydrolase family protein [Calidifontibacter sp. DB2511S]
MRLANLDGRAALITTDGRALDVHKASDGRFGPELRAVYDNWSPFVGWAQQAPLDEAVPYDAAGLRAPSPEPRQILAIGLNYGKHAKESGFDSPTGLPPVFPKFLSSLSGPVTEVTLPNGGNTDWEVELVAVIGRTARQVSEADAWDYVAGLTVGQDISERVIQLSGPAPQFGLGKSYPGFAPTGPWLVTPDELPDRNDLHLTCSLDEEVVQDGRTADLLVPVARLIAELSKVVTLYPGDLLFTGTPDGVGLGRKPQRFIQPGEVLVSSIEGIGELRQTFVTADGKDQA